MSTLCLSGEKLHVSRGRRHLDSVRLFGVFVMNDAEAQRVFGTFYQHQGGALKTQRGKRWFFKSRRKQTKTCSLNLSNIVWYSLRCAPCRQSVHRGVWWWAACGRTGIASSRFWLGKLWRFPPEPVLHMWWGQDLSSSAAETESPAQNTENRGGVFIKGLILWIL